MPFDRVCLIGICLMFAVVGQSAMAQTLPPKPLNDKPLHEKPVRAVKPEASNPCAQYGAGFARVEGSSTCVKVGGSISVGVGGSR